MLIDSYLKAGRTLECYKIERAGGGQKWHHVGSLGRFIEGSESVKGGLSELTFPAQACP